MKTKIFIGCVLILVILAAAAFSFAGESQKDKGMSIEGTYQLVSRTLPDGTKMGAPDVMGLMTFTKGHRNFNVVWRAENGEVSSFSVLSTYKFSETEYSETVYCSIFHDAGSGKGVQYDLSERSASAPVTVKDGKIEFNFPHDPPTAVFEGNKLTATAEGFVDVWEKVE